MLRRPPRSTRTYTLCPYTTLFRSLMASGFTFAAQLPASIKAKGEIVVAIMPNYPPMDFKDPATNTLTGLDYDLGNALAERLGVKIKRSEEHTSELQSLMRISYAVFCLKKKKKQPRNHNNHTT